MSGALTDTSILAGSAGVVSGYTIDQSLRFNPGDSPYLTRTPGSASNRQTFTISTWVKNCCVTSVSEEYGVRILAAYTDTSNVNVIYIPVYYTHLTLPKICSV